MLLLFLHCSVDKAGEYQIYKKGIVLKKSLKRKDYPSYFNYDKNV